MMCGHGQKHTRYGKVAKHTSYFFWDIWLLCVQKSSKKAGQRVMKKRMEKQPSTLSSAFWGLKIDALEA